MFLYRSTDGGILKNFEFAGLFYLPTSVPVQRCRAYSPLGANCTVPPSPLGEIECPDAFTAPTVSNIADTGRSGSSGAETHGGINGNDDDGSTNQVLIGSLGCGGLGLTAYWTAPKWSPGAPFTPRTEGILDFGVMYAPKTGSSADGKRRILFGVRAASTRTLVVSARPP